MQSYSPAARAYLALVWSLGLIVCTLTFLHPADGAASVLPPGVALAVVLAAGAGARKINITRSERYSGMTSMSLGFLIDFAVLLTFGLRAGILVGLVSGLSASLSPRRKPLHQLLFNVAAIPLCVWASGQVFLAINDYHTLGGKPIDVIGFRSVYAVLAATLLYFLLNTGLVAGVVALCNRERFREVWLPFRWTLPSYFAGASFAVLGGLLLNSDARLLLAIPVLIFTYGSYRTHAEKSEQQQKHIEELQAGRQQLTDLYLSTVQSLTTAIGAKERSTHAHIHRVQRYAIAIAAHLQVTGDEMEAIKTGSLLHDIGKLGVPDYVLLKPGPLTADEFEKMKRHVEIGASILEPVPFPWPVKSLVRHHHEKWDGSGYPDGLAGEAIPLGARILAVADVYDALTSDRSYRCAWPASRALEHIQAQSGRQFDPGIVAAFLEIAPALGDADATARAESRVLPAEENVSRHIRRSASELWALYEVSQSLHSGLDMNARLEQLCAKITTALPGTTCAFLLHETQRGEAQSTAEDDGEWTCGDLSVWAAAGANGEMLRGAHLVGADCPTAWVARSRHIYRGPYTEDLVLATPNAAWKPVRSALIVPLIHLGEQLGTINLYHAEANAFSTDDEHLLTMIAEQVQSAIHHDIVFDQTVSASLTDSLTGLYNSRYLAQQMSGATGDNVRCALLFLDLDNFKPVNDNFGHPQGNIVLQRVAQLLQRELRPDDLVVRDGGDEFMIVLRHTDETGARQAAARIRHTIRDYRTGLLHGERGELRLDVSIGIACCPGDGTELNALIALADRRMYADKTRHRTRKNRIPPLPTLTPEPGANQTVLALAPEETGEGEATLPPFARLPEPEPSRAVIRSYRISPRRK